MLDCRGATAAGGKGGSMTVYIRPYGDDKNDGSSADKAVRSAQQAAKVALRNQDLEISIDVFDFDRIFRELDRSSGFARAMS